MTEEKKIRQVKIEFSIASALGVNPRYCMVWPNQLITSVTKMLTRATLSCQLMTYVKLMATEQMTERIRAGRTMTTSKPA